MTALLMRSVTVLLASTLIDPAAPAQAGGPKRPVRKLILSSGIERL